MNLLNILALTGLTISIMAMLMNIILGFTFSKYKEDEK
jgi:hypothetical protein